MAEKVGGDNPVWELNSGHWIQDDEKKIFQIADRTTNRIHENQKGLDVIYGAKLHEKSESGCKGFFPPEFEYCSFCGKKLVNNENCNDIWIPPFGGGTGLRKSHENIRINRDNVKQESAVSYIDQDKDMLPLPRPRGDYEFLVAPLGTRSSVLVAFDRTTGLIDYYSPAVADVNKWISLKCAPKCRVAESNLPNWSWSAASIFEKSGFAVPTDEGPVWLSIDWGNASYKPVYGTGKCVGGAAVIEDHIFVPVETAESIVIQNYDVVGGKWQHVAEISRKNVTRQENGNDFFSIPVVASYRRILYWIGITGLLTFDFAKHFCSWRSWETDQYPCQAMPEFGPPYQDQMGNYWQLCYDEYDQSQESRAFRYYRLNGDDSNREDVDGGRFSSGVSCYSKLYEYWETPWENIDERRQDKAGKVRVPILCLNEGTKSTVVAHFSNESNTPFLQMLKDRDKMYHIDLTIEGPNNLPIRLRTDHVFNINAPWELRMFIYRNHVFAYSTKEAACYKWRLK